jgi:catechol 2,3-dioxygenase-like lactoylglutathione lyase family enzyme
VRAAPGLAAVAWVRREMRAGGYGRDAVLKGGEADMVDMKLEVDMVPVSDVERAKEFYQSLGWRLDVTPPGIVQLTPPGSWCSVQFGTNLTSAAPGSAKGYLIVSDIEAARDQLVGVGIEASEIYHLGSGGRIGGPAPDHKSYGSWVSFADPDGNSWVLQEVTARLAGRVDPGETSFGSASDLATVMRRAAMAHGEHEKRIGQADANWPDWYAAYMFAEESGTDLPT